VNERLAALSPEKRALLEERLLRARLAAPPRGIPRRNSEGPAPLSCPQQRLWFLDQLAPQQPTYNAAIALRVSGPLDLGRLEACISIVIGRHEALRTVFRRGPDGAPRQVVLEDWGFRIDAHDLLKGSADRVEAREAEALAQARTESRRPFDLERDLMLRTSAFRVAADEHLLLFVEHHIAFDGWSDEQLFRELAECYDAAAASRPPVLDALPIQYADWAVWQGEQLSTERLTPHIDYWREALDGAPALIELPLDHPRPRLQSFAGEHRPFELPDRPATAVHALAREQRATPFMVLAAAFVAGLQRWSGADDIVLGSPIASREQVELEHLIGLFSNTFVLRVRADGAPTLRELIRRTREAALGAYEHQALPFEKLVEAIAPRRDPGFNPIFQVNVRVRSEDAPTLRLSGLSTQPVELDVGFSRFDLAVEFHLHGDGRVGGYLEYSHALFEDATARRVAANLVRLTSDGLRRPDVPISALDWEAPAVGQNIKGRRWVTS
jgi:Condensation domain